MSTYVYVDGKRIKIQPGCYNPTGNPKRVYRPDSQRMVEPVAELNRLNAELHLLREHANYLAAEVNDDWEKGRISIDTKNAADAWEKLNVPD